MNIPSNHIFYTSSPDITDIAKPLTKLGIINFSFTRSYHDGSRIYLEDRCDVLDIYFKEKLYLQGNTECNPVNYNDQVLLWSSAPNQHILDVCSRALGIDHGIFMFDPHEHYCDIFVFATYSGNERIVNTYLSKMDLLKSFKEYFREQAAPIIKQAEKQKVVLPFNESLDIKTILIDIEDDKMLKPTLHHDYFLTDRQLECCSLMLKGFTAKEMGSRLNLSARTIESYLEIIKIKLNCKNKAELIIKLLKIMK